MPRTVSSPHCSVFTGKEGKGRGLTYVSKCSFVINQQDDLQKNCVMFWLSQENGTILFILGRLANEDNVKSALVLVICLQCCLNMSLLLMDIVPLPGCSVLGKVFSLSTLCCFHSALSFMSSCIPGSKHRLFYRSDAWKLLGKQVDITHID